MYAQQRRLLSAGQERLWFLQQFNAASGAGGLYNEHASVRFDGTLNVPAMHQALGEVARRHESLRWVIESERGSYVAVARDEPFERCVLTFDLEAIADPAERERTYRRCATEVAREPFDLATGPLFRIALFRLSKRELAMAVVMHHIITDAWSMHILVEDLCNAYSSISVGRPIAGGEVDYSDAPDTGLEHGDAATLEQLTYWTTKLANAPPSVSLPTHRPRPDPRTFAGAKQYFTLHDEAIAPMRARMREERVTRFILLLALWNAYLGANAGRRDLVVGVTTAGRDRNEAERRLGFFANTVALRTEFSVSDSFRQYLRQVRAVALEGLDHQQIPFERVVQELRLPRSANRQPLFEVMFVYVNTAVLDLAIPGVNVRLTPEDITLGLTKFDLVLCFWERGAGIQGLIDYSTELYDGPEIGAHIARFQTFAARAVADPDRAIDELVPIERVPRRVIEDLRSASLAG
jgi:condensation domain-containing protein